MKDYEKKNRKRLAERQRSMRMKNLQATEHGVELGGHEYTQSADDEQHNGKGNFGQATALAHGNDKVIVKEQTRASDVESAREAAMSQLAHKAAKDDERSRVLPAIAIGASKRGAPTIVMSLMENGDCEKMFGKLVDGLGSAVISPEEYVEAVRYLGREIALGLVQMHSIHMVHRDIKPDNVFLDDEMNVKIGDFGLATWEGDNGKDGAGEGHKYYAAPEERGGDINNNAMKKLPTSPAADIHCLGRTLRRFAARGPGGMPKLEALALQMSAVDPKVRPTAAEVANHPALLGADGVAKKVFEKVKKLEGADVKLVNEPRIIKALKQFDPKTGEPIGNPYDRSPRQIQGKGDAATTTGDADANHYLRSPLEDQDDGYLRTPDEETVEDKGAPELVDIARAESAPKRVIENPYGVRIPAPKRENPYGVRIAAPSPRPKLKRRAGVWNLLG